LTIQRKRVAKRLASGLLAGALALGGLAISGGTASAKLPSSPSTNRIYGADRYETSVAIARNQMGTTAPTGLVIASGEVVADALAAASLTSSTMPMLLVRKDSVPTAVADFIADNKAAMSLPTTAVPVYVIGGENVISTEVFDAIKAAVTLSTDTTPPTVTRVFGADRYATAKAIGEVTGITDADDTMYIVNGEDGKWADALSAGRFASAGEDPIVLVKSSGMDPSGQAQIDAYIAKTSSAKKFIVIGGPASVPTSVEEYLVATKMIPVANITRYGGADRYQTNYLVEGYLGGGAGYNVALTSGQAPYDALAAAAWAASKGVHLILTPTSGGSAFAAGVAGAGDLYARLLDSTAPGAFGSVLYVIGGRAAVSDTAKSEYLGAATASDLTVESLTGCVTSSQSLTMTLSGSLTDLEYASTSGTQAPESWTVNGAKLTSGNVTVAAVNSPGGTPNKVFSVTFTSTLAVNSVVKFVGWTQGATVGASNYVAQRNIASSNCTVATDVTRPTITLRAISGTTVGASTAAAKILLTSSKPVSINSAAGLVIVGASTSGQAATVTNLDSSKKQFLITLAANETGVSPTWASLTSTPSLVKVSTGAITDLSSNLNPLVAEAFGELDAVAATPTVAGVSCYNSATNVTLKSGDLVFTAAASSTKGANGSNYKLVVVNQRGLNIPTVAVDSTAMTITVTADVGYHSTADIANVVNSTYGTGADPIADSWEVSGGSATGKLAATLVPVTASSLGSGSGLSNCQVLLTSSEPFFLASTGAAVALINLSTAYFPVTGLLGGSTYSESNVASAIGSRAYSKVLEFNTPYLGSGTITFNAGNAGLKDLNGNSFLGSITIDAAKSGSKPASVSLLAVS
jgi:putative cell wall-binding protein